MEFGSLAIRPHLILLLTNLLLRLPPHYHLHFVGGSVYKNPHSRVDIDPQIIPFIIALDGKIRYCTWSY
jgi:hypothetical protein